MFKTINQWCSESGLSRVYVHRMVLKGVIPTRKVQIATNTFRHEISDEDWNKFRETRNKTKREDGRNRFILYGTTEEVKKVMDLLNENGVGAVVQKPKNYYKK